MPGTVSNVSPGVRSSSPRPTGAGAARDAVPLSREPAPPARTRASGKRSACARRVPARVGQRSGRSGPCRTNKSRLRRLLEWTQLGVVQTMSSGHRLILGSSEDEEIEWPGVVGSTRGRQREVAVALGTAETEAAVKVLCCFVTCGNREMGVTGASFRAPVEEIVEDGPGASSSSCVRKCRHAVDAYPGPVVHAEPDSRHALLVVAFDKEARWRDAREDRASDPDLECPAASVHSPPGLEPRRRGFRAANDLPGEVADVGMHRAPRRDHHARCVGLDVPPFCERYGESGWPCGFCELESWRQGSLQVGAPDGVYPFAERDIIEGGYSSGTEGQNRVRPFRHTAGESETPAVEG